MPLFFFLLRLGSLGLKEQQANKQGIVKEKGVVVGICLIIEPNLDTQRKKEENERVKAVMVMVMVMVTVAVRLAAMTGEPTYLPASLCV